MKLRANGANNGRPNGFSGVDRELMEDDRRLRVEFAETIGKRTLTLLKDIGDRDRSAFAEENGPDPVYSVASSKLFSFRLPGDYRDYSLSVDVKHSSLTTPIAKTPWNIYGGQLNFSQINGSESKNLAISLDQDSYIKGTAIEGQAYRREADHKSRHQIAEYISYLDLAENLVFEHSHLEITAYDQILPDVFSQRDK